METDEVIKLVDNIYKVRISYYFFTSIENLTWKNFCSEIAFWIISYVCFYYLLIVSWIRALRAQMHSFHVNNLRDSYSWELNRFVAIVCALHHFQRHFSLSLSSVSLFGFSAQSRSLEKLPLFLPYRGLHFALSIGAFLLWAETFTFFSLLPSFSFCLFSLLNYSLQYSC